MNTQYLFTLNDMIVMHLLLLCSVIVFNSLFCCMWQSLSHIWCDCWWLSLCIIGLTHIGSCVWRLGVARTNHDPFLTDSRLSFQCELASLWNGRIECKRLFIWSDCTKCSIIIQKKIILLHGKWKNRNQFGNFPFDELNQEAEG